MIKIEDINKKKKLKKEIFIFCLFFFVLILITACLLIYTLRYEASELFHGISYGLSATLIVCFLAVSIGLRFKTLYAKEIEEAVKSSSSKRTTKQELITATAELFNGKIPQNHKVVIYMISLDRLNNVAVMFGYDKEKIESIVDEFRTRVEYFLGKKDVLALMEDNSIALLSVADKKTVDETIKQLANKIEQPYSSGSSDALQLKVHIGINIQKNESWHHADAFVNKAQMALQHAALSEGTKFVIYKDSLSDSIVQLYNAETKLRRAILNKEFEVAYQPKIDPSAFKVVGAEALFRWKNLPDGYNIGSIIELAESKNLIDDITKIIFEKVFIDIKKWEKQGRKYKIAMNLSPKTLNDRNFVNWFKGLMDLHGVNPKMVEIEITETAIIENGRAIEAINGIKALGCSIAIDDFGVGHSSLGYLVDIPADIIKIDRSFIIPLTVENEKHRAVVSSIIHLAHRMGCKVVAEGVENPEQLKILQDENCDMIQGYLFSKPLPPDLFDNFMPFDDDKIRNN